MPEAGNREKIASRLLHPDRDFDPDAPLPWNWEDTFKDLEMNTLIEKMARNDGEIRKVSQAAILFPLGSENSIRYRQDVVRDSIANKDSIRKMRSILQAAVKKARSHLFWITRSGRNPEFALHESISVMGIYLSALTELREITKGEKQNFTSEGFSKLFYLFTEIFDEEYSASMSSTLHRLGFPGGVRISGGLGVRSELTGFSLLRPEAARGMKRALARVKDRRYTYVLPPRDEHGPEELSNIRARGIISVVKVLDEAGEKVFNFIRSLSSELAFLEGCINLAEDLGAINAEVCYPEPVPDMESHLSFSSLYDMALSLNLGIRAVPNDLQAGEKRLTIITGANRGGKSTFLRSVGQAALMMQAGMFVGATEFSSSLYSGVYTHFKREEDRSMEQGKFDEELGRMDRIVDHLATGSLILFNESFAATNAKEGSEIAGEIVDALMDSHMTVIFVTHLAELAQYFTERGNREIRFLVAERTSHGERTFRILPGKPENTSYGPDLFEKVFGEPLAGYNIPTEENP